MALDKDYEIRHTPPEATRTMRGMSRAGYTPMTAMADIVDNSLAAGATKIKIITEDLVGNKTRVYISDNGHGMSSEILAKAMAFGSGEELANSELSVYGLGMKIASLQISPGGFTVLTRDKSGVVSSASWNMEDQPENPWGLRWYKDGKHNPTYLAHLDDVAGSKGSGTVIVWESADLSKADRFEKARGGKEKTQNRILSRLVEHLGLTFHRWIEGSVPNTEPVRIIFNGEYVDAWNPFDPQFLDSEQVEPVNPWPVIVPATKSSPKKETKLVLSPWVMRTDLTKHERDELARRKLKWQGVYVYRLNRLIQEPGWLDLIDARHNALNGLRFALEIDPVLDDFLSLDVKKSSIRLPDQITEIIRPVIEEYEKSEQVKSDKARTRRNNQATPESLLEITSKRIAEVSKQSGIPSFEPLTPSLVVVTNVSGKHEHRVKPLPVDGPSDMSVDWVDDLDGGLLWETHYGPNHDVRIRVNRSHDFYQKIILLAADNPIIFNGFLEILWAFSRAEFDSARGDKTQFAEMRRFMSLTLSLAAENVEELELDPVE